jgi:two-component system sensor histidine kinase TctE
VRERLFQPFVQGRRALPGGTGLGLAICGDIVQSLGGSIQLINREPPDGTETLFAGPAHADASTECSGLDALVRLPLASMSPDNLDTR